MEAINNFTAFLAACVMLNITPGNDTILILTKSIAQGKRAGMVSAFGIAGGTIIHTLFAALGLSIVISKSIMLFTIIKYAGALYIIYIGVKMILSRSSIVVPEGEGRSDVSELALFRDGFLSNVLNPKVALFFIAFLPQFVSPAYQNGVVPFLILGFTFTTTGTIYSVLLALFSARMFRNLRENASVTNWINKVCGSVLVGLGAYVAMARR